MRFNPPPNWPVRPEWTPEPGWQPPAEWSEPPYGWVLWQPDHPESSGPARSPAPQAVGAGGSDNETGDPDAPVDEPKRTQGVWAKAAENPVWTTLGAVVGIVGLVISIVQIYQAMQTPPVDLEVSALTINAQQSVPGSVTGGDTATRSMEVTPIDLTLQNKGGKPALITRIDTEVVYFQQLRDCTGAAPTPETIAAKYDIPIPMQGAVPADKQLSTEVRFEVKPGAADRMVLSLGPGTQPGFATTPMVLSAKITLIHDDDEALDVGAVSLVTTVGAATAQIDAVGSSPSPETRSCAQENLSHLDEMVAIQATRSQVLDRLRSAYQQVSV